MDKTAITLINLKFLDNIMSDIGVGIIFTTLCTSKYFELINVNIPINAFIKTIHYILKFIYILQS